MIVKLGSLISEYSVRNKADENIPVYSVTNEQGFCTGYFSKEVASQDRTTYKIVPRGCFAYNPSRINVGSVDVQECEDRVIVSPLYVVFSVDEKLNRRYLLHYLKSDITLTYIKAYASGSVRDNLKFSILKDFPINLPSAEEQEQIVATLDGIEHLIALRKEELDSLDELVKSRFIELIHNNNIRYVKLKDVAEDGRIITYGIVKPGEHTEGGVPIIKVKDFPNGTILMSDMLLASPEIESKYERSRVKEGDLLFSIRGSVGRTAFVPKELIDANITQDTARISVGTDFNPHYIRAALGFDSVQQEINEHVRGVAVRGISLAELRDIGIPIVEKKTQDEFGRFVEQTDKSKLAVQKALEELEILKKSLMQQYFG